MKFRILIIAILLGSTSLFGQRTETFPPTYTGTVSSMEFVPSLASRMSELTPAVDVNTEAQDKRSIAQYLNVEPKAEQNDPLVENRHEAEQSVRMTPPSLVFDAYTSSSQPTDPSLAIGPNHVFVVYNTGFTIYDKEGNQLLGQTSPSPAIFPNGGCCDLTVSYDNAADRWILSFLGNGAQIAISDGSNPLTSGWNVYTISTISDYQKLSVWSDGYYLTDNTTSSNKVWVLERTALLNGNPSAQVRAFNLPGISTFGFYSPQVFSVTDGNLPATGGATVVYMQDDAWSGVSYDHLKFWTIDPNWGGSGSVSGPVEFPVSSFIGVFDNGSFANLKQPGRGRKVNIDALQATIMNQAQFRKFSTHNSALFNFVVDTEPSSGEQAGIRWYEFRQSGDNQPWTLYQEGTYTAADNKHAWNASLAMDGQGNIGMGYSGMSSQYSNSRTYVSSFFTGRMAGDPLGAMTGVEELISEGNNKIPGTRYGDYSKIDVDPSDDTSFWYITEYYNNSRRGVVGKFQISTSTGPDEQAPTEPGNVAVNDITETSATLSWDPSTDNVGVTGYNVYLNGDFVSATQNLSFDFSGLTPDTQYQGGVEATDAAGNISTRVTVLFTTLQVDNEAPTVPTGVTASNITSGGATISWNASTDNVGVTGYNIAVDGVLVANISGTSYNLVGLNPLTSYLVSVTAQDAAGNESDPGSTSFTTLEGNTGGGEIAAYYFETGLQGWIDGGRLCRLQSTSNSCEGNQSIRLRNGQSSSLATSPAIDLSGNTEVIFNMQVYASGMDNGDDFFVDYFDGSSYQPVGQYVRGTDFANGVCFPVEIVLDASFNFASNSRFRVRNSANQNNDQIWFDEVIITGDAAPLTEPTDRSQSLATQAKILTMNSGIDLYPNPTRSRVSIQFEKAQFDRVSLYSTTGVLIDEREIHGQNQMDFDLSNLPSGVYFLKFMQGKLAVSKRIIKQ